jgi:hypothetical protein
MRLAVELGQSYEHNNEFAAVGFFHPLLQTPAKIGFLRRGLECRPAAFICEGLSSPRAIEMASLAARPSATICISIFPDSG